jgi:hypothetical protein
MTVKETMRALRRYLEDLEAALDYDPYTNIRVRVERLERLVADLDARMPA